MTSQENRWTDAIAAANTDDARRRLLSEVGMWRATRLTDIEASREATFALSQIHSLLKERDKAVSEARQLLSLCQTQPLAPRGQFAAAKVWMTSLGEKLPKMVEPPRERREPNPRERREPNSRGENASRGGRERPARAADPLDKAIASGANGQFAQGLASMRDRRGAKAVVVRAWLTLSQALTWDDAKLQREELDTLRDNLAGWLRVGEVSQASAAPAAARPAREPRAERAPREDNSNLAKLLGQPVPRRREALVTALHGAAANGNPDAVAAEALRHHHENAGANRAAPWLVGSVARARAAGDTPLTDGALAELGAAGSVAIQAYTEAPFGLMVDLYTAAAGAGWEPISVRRGVMARDEREDRRLWTLRVKREDGEALVVLAPELADDENAGVLGERIVHLCSRVVLVAGDSHGKLREAATAAGAAVQESLDMEAVWQLLAGQAPPAPRKRRQRKTDEAKRDTSAEPAETKAAPRERGPSREVVLKDALMAENLPEVADLVPLIAAWGRPWRAIQSAERNDLNDGQVACLLQAVHIAADDPAPIPGGTTLALKTASAGGMLTRAVLTEGETANRYGGVGVGDVLAVAAAAVADGWTVHRVLRGATRKERERHPVLGTVSEHLQSLWRLLINKDDKRAELWYVAGLAPEGRAGVPMLLLEEHLRVVVLPIDPDLLAWYGEQSGPEAIGWTGDEAAEVVAALASLP
ncbi:MAG: hypothetical protein GWP91_04195 [Rhodobacterales bacterium]|nr:hypothetical protein [Rhodobacterales bacterium]